MRFVVLQSSSGVVAAIVNYRHVVDRATQTTILDNFVDTINNQTSCCIDWRSSTSSTLQRLRARYATQPAPTITHAIVAQSSSSPLLMLASQSSSSSSSSLIVEPSIFESIVKPIFEPIVMPIIERRYWRRHRTPIEPLVVALHSCFFGVSPSHSQIAHTNDDDDLHLHRDSSSMQKVNCHCCRRC